MSSILMHQEWYSNASQALNEKKQNAGSYYFNTKTNDLLCRLSVMKLCMYIKKVSQGLNVLTLADTAVLNPRIWKMRNVTSAFIS